MTGWNATNASNLANLANQFPSTSVALTSSGWPATSTWWTVANHLSAVTFTGYDQNMNVTSTASAIRTLGITVQYPGQPAEQEQLTLAGTTQYTATVTRPLVIPPDPPDPRTCN
jgi:hypothetical protein